MTAEARRGDLRTYIFTCASEGGTCGNTCFSGKERKMSEKAKRQRRRTFLYLWILLALLILLVTATYTWFTISQTPHVNDMAMYVNVETGIQIAKEFDAPESEWGYRIDFADLIGDEYPLKPATWSSARQKFFAMRYGFDGRMMEFAELSDEKNSNRSDGDGYYVLGTFYVRTDMSCYVQLAEAVEINDGENGAGTYVIGKPIWDEEKIAHYDGGNGAESAIRIGFRITHYDKATGEEKGEPEFFIYEPSCDHHISGSTEYFPTPSIDGTDSLIDDEHLILQHASTWEEADPVEHGVTVKHLGAFKSNKRLFKIESSEKIRVDVYIWLEGQDSDCIARIDNAKILANLQFSVDYSGQSGYEDITDDTTEATDTDDITEPTDTTEITTDNN